MLRKVKNKIGKTNRFFDIFLLELEPFYAEIQ